VNGSIEALEHRDAAGAIRRLAIPAAFAFLSEQLLGIADTIAIGSLGTRALAGITAATAVFLVFGIGMYAFGSGLRILGAQAIGAGRSDRFGTIVRSSTVVPLAFACALAIVMTFLAFPLMHAMLPAGAPAASSARYLALRFWCLLPMVFSSALIVAATTSGDTKLGLRVLLVINAIHIPLLCVLALGLGTHHPFGVAGAGVSSLVAELVGFVYAGVDIARRPELRIFSSWRIEAALVRETTSLSWPDFVFLSLQILPEPVTIALLAPRGVEIVAAYRALAVVNDLTWALPGPLGDAVEVVIGQRIGARDYAGARAFFRSALRIDMLVCTVAALAVAAAAWPLATLCTLNPMLGTLAAVPLAAHVLLTLPLKGFAMTVGAPIRASGDTRWVMVMGIVTTAIAIVGIAASIEFGRLDLWAYPIGWTLGWLFRDGATLVRFRSGDWERRRLVSIPN
jgi:putative MATE family efflux protein